MRQVTIAIVALCATAGCAGRIELPPIGVLNEELGMALADSVSGRRVYLPQDVAVRAAYPDDPPVSRGGASGAGDSWVTSNSSDPYDAATRVQARADRGRSVIDHYPRAASGSQGQVRVRFVVGADGRAERNTIEARGASTTRALSIVVRDVRKWSFSPARLSDGTPVRQLVEMNVIVALPYRSITIADSLGRVPAY